MCDRKCFVIMSFKPEYDMVYQSSIKKAVEENGLICVRVDDDRTPQNIPTKIVREIIEADVIIADLTESSPNVYYELGISHTLGNKTIIISQHLDNLPFDIRNEFSLGYTNDRVGIRLLYLELEKMLPKLLDNPHSPTNIVQIAGQEYFDNQRKIRENLEKLQEERERIKLFDEYLKNKRYTNNQDVIKKLSKNIVEISSNHPENCTFVGISGAAALGKTQLAKEIVEWFMKNIPDWSINILPLDAFMLNRAEREFERLSGYNPKSNRINEVEKTLSKLKANKKVHFYEYNHRKGEHEKDKTVLGQSRIIVVDGIHSFHPKLLPYLHYKIYIYAQSPIALELRFLTDLFERKYLASRAFRHAEEEYENYLKYVYEYVKFSDIVLDIDGYWRFKL